LLRRTYVHHRIHLNHRVIENFVLTDLSSWCLCGSASE
jgi:hypothetical protein